MKMSTYGLAVYAGLSVVVGYLWLWGYARTLSPQVASVVVSTWADKVGLIAAGGGVIVGLFFVAFAYPGLSLRLIHPEYPKRAPLKVLTFVVFFLPTIAIAVGYLSISANWFYSALVVIIIVEVVLISLSRKQNAISTPVVALLAAATVFSFVAALLALSWLPHEGSTAQTIVAIIVVLCLGVLLNCAIATWPASSALATFAVLVVAALIYIYRDTMVSIPFTSAGVANFDVNVSPLRSDAAFQAFRARCASEASGSTGRNDGSKYHTYQVHVIFSTGTEYAVRCGSGMVWLRIPDNGTWLLSTPAPSPRH